jgi:hypothetical protein
MRSPALFPAIYPSTITKPDSFSHPKTACSFAIHHLLPSWITAFFPHKASSLLLVQIQPSKFLTACKWPNCNSDGTRSSIVRQTRTTPLVSIVSGFHVDMRRSWSQLGIGVPWLSFSYVQRWFHMRTGRRHTSSVASGANARPWLLGRDSGRGY